ncbi:hypothetical protein PP707_01050 [Acetobacter pasteurianus]|nr:hypothetical protein [Acetobacter pasteurianus]
MFLGNFPATPNQTIHFKELPITGYDLHHQCLSFIDTLLFHNKTSCMGRATMKSLAS